jgi:1-acyl-sn-glycerol-3-phosphate acyltransferase
MASITPLAQPKTLIERIRGVAMSSAITVNTFVVGPPVMVVGLAQALTPKKISGEALSTLAVKLANKWIGFNGWLIDHSLPKIEWQLTMPIDLSLNDQYLLICNHQSWVDTTVMQYIGLPRMPLTRFFTKWELIFIPFLGLAFKILGFPMMKRHGKDAIAKNPALKGQDFNEARRACEALLGQPFTLLNYLEGTRFTVKKHAAQKSPYANLLKPKAGGLGLAMQILGSRVQGLLDMTIVYPDGIPEYSDFWMGRVRRIGVDLRRIDIPDWVLSGDYENDKVYRAKFHTWVSTLWANKQQLIEQIHARFNQQDDALAPDALRIPATAKE